MATIARKSSLELEIYAETLAEFTRKNVFMDLITKKTITEGKSAQFIDDTDKDAVQRINATTGLPEDTTGVGAVDGYVNTHANGANQRDGASDIYITERTIVVERPIFVRKQYNAFEEKVAHYDGRSIITGQVARTMANYIDRRILVELDQAVSAVSTETQYASSNVFNSEISGGATAEAKGDAILDAIFAGNAALDGNDQIGEQRYFVTSNVNYYNLLQSQKAVNRDFNAGDNGSIADGNVFRIGDVTILRSNNLSATLAPVTVAKVGNGDELAGFLFNKRVIGMVELMGLQTKTWFDDDYDETVFKAQLAGGWDVLNPGSLCSITTGVVNV